ncbi:formylglycine-generating enzyme family protein [Sessilibacter sp. MAH4]
MQSLNKKAGILVIAMASAVAQAQERVLIKAGAFQMGCSINDTHCEQDEGEAGGVRVEVPSFYIDQYEVTVAQYQGCIDEGKCDRPKDHDRNKYCNLGAPGRDNHPVNCVDWQQALTYCQSKNGRLPYEAEWEKAARATSKTRYPWGQEVSCANAIVDDGVTQGSVANEPDGCGEDRTWPVGSKPANGYGLYDMHGNAGEWTMNWYTANGLSIYAEGDLQAPANGARKVVRGGSWDENKNNLRSSFRNVKLPDSGKTVYGSIGFRCAYDL